MATVFINDEMRENSISQQVIDSLEANDDHGANTTCFCIAIANPTIEEEGVTFKDSHQAITITNILPHASILSDGSGIRFDLSSYTGKFNSDETGTATNFRIALFGADGLVSRTDGVIQGTVGLFASGADIEARDVNITSGQEYRLPEGLTVTFPNQFTV